MSADTGFVASDDRRDARLAADEARLTTVETESGVTNALASTSASKLFVAGTHTTTSGEASANTLTIATGLSSITVAIVQVLDAGNNVVTTDADVTWSAGDLVVADGATYNTVNGQKISWMAFGT